MNTFKKYIELLKVSHYVRIITLIVLIAIGSIFGTPLNYLEVEKDLWLNILDIPLWIGVAGFSFYALLLAFLAVYNVTSKTAYKPGDFNVHRDGDFEEWKKKNNIGTGKVDKFIDWLDDPFNVYKNR